MSSLGIRAIRGLFTVVEGRRLERLASPHTTATASRDSGHATEGAKTKWIRRELLDELARWVRATGPGAAG